MSDLKSQLKSLEEKNMIYMQKNIDLEEVRRQTHPIESWDRTARPTSVAIIC